MTRVGIKSVVYHGDSCLGDVEVFPVKAKNFQPFPNKEIRIDRLSPPSERCLPLAVIHTISPFSLKCKIQAKSATEQSPLTHLYLSCFQELKTAVVSVGTEELHLIAMPSKVEKVPSFWCCAVQAGLYASCMAMLNLRCLAIVFDLDETLIVANTMKSFEDKIEVLSRRIDDEDDPVRVSGMSAELKRYLEDKELLRQYIEGDSVLDGGKPITIQNEEVPALPGGHSSLIRPIIRLQERNIILTRINPEIRDTSVLVRLRPAWDDLKSYLTAKGRKRFEVYVCTMAERDYALEMWRLLDPEANLICSKQLLDRVVCVKSGHRKSLLQVFQDGIFHPKMAMVIDDRMKVWDDKDQLRVHVVPPFAPYYAPQAEMANAVPVLCVARNVACNVRGGFFKEFDENLYQRVVELCYENEMADLPQAPDVSHYLFSEDSGAVLNNNRDIPLSEATNGAEVEASLRIASSGNQQPEQHQLQSSISSFSGDELTVNQESTDSRDMHTGATSYITALQEIARICGWKVEFKPVMRNHKDLQFSVEVLISTKKIGVGSGRTRKEAKMQAAENSLRNLEDDYLAFASSDRRVIDGGLGKLSLGGENGFLKDTDVAPASEFSEKEDPPYNSKTEDFIELDVLNKLSAVLSCVNELCMEGQSLVFQDQGPVSTMSKGHYCFQAEIDGKILGKGVGLSIEEAKLKAAEETLKILKASGDLSAQKHLHSSRSRPTSSPSPPFSQQQLPLPNEKTSL
ncbi:Protein-serine/threonine phosphatase protein [Dioscorea alata]|uniref:Protein-serine/threonine phosphatase protein n=1 Tax=Dioscorea alata TaxID=55571 RepID=A0ACB7WMD5_DIOAL|nr:Protein-serine/threonine phosphatase protein [Dioscorea alata]